MSVDFDVIIVGSGPAGISAAFPLVESGLNVLMVDGGKQSIVPLLKNDYLSTRTYDSEQWKWMVGEDFHALKMRDAISPKLRVPSQAYSFAEFNTQNNINSTSFISVGSLATGGLSNSWGCGVAKYSAAEIKQFPFPKSDLELSYANVSLRIGISGKANDDMSEYFGLDDYAQPPINMDISHTYLSQNYLKHKKKLNTQGFKMGLSRVAALSKDTANRKACNLSGNCLWGCNRKSLYSSADELPKLRINVNFREHSGFIVENLDKKEGYWQVKGRDIIDNSYKVYKAKKVVMAAGTLATTRIVLQTLKYTSTVPLYSSPSAAFLLWLPRFLALKRQSGFGLGQLSYALNIDDSITAFGSTFATTGIPLSEFARYVPFKRPYGIELLRTLLSSCVTGNLFLPGNLTNAQAQLTSKNSLEISGKYSDKVKPLMNQAQKKLRKTYARLGAILLPKTFMIGQPGGDIHYVGTLPMKHLPSVGETSSLGEVKGLDGIYVVDGACLPFLTEKSHTLTIMANADRIGKYISKNVFLHK
jgi:hypothetical protein